MRRALACGRCFFAALLLASTAPLAAESTVAGAVFGPSGQPFADAQIELVPLVANFEAGRLRLAGRREPSPVAEVRSDATGRYLLRAPGPGVFKIVVRAEGRLAMQLSPRPLVEEEELPPVSLAADAGARLTVQDALGRPLAEAWVFAASSEEREKRGRVAGGWRPDVRVGRTGADGLVSLPRLAGERLDVSVFPPGGAEVRKLDLEGGTIVAPVSAGAVHRLRVVSPRGEPVTGVLARAGDLAWPRGLTDAEGWVRIPCALGEALRVRLVAPDGRQQVVDLPAASAGSEATVVLADPRVVSGRILEQESARPLAGALVSPGLDPGAFLLTDAEGRYRLVAPDPQGLSLHASAALHLPRSSPLTASHLRSGRAPTLALARSTALRGQVVDLQGHPVAGATLAALPDLDAEGVLPVRPAGRAAGLAASDAAGRFELRPLRAGGFYEVRASRPGYLPASVEALAPARSQEAAALKVVLSPARAARGRVQDAAGRPLAGVEVRLAPAGSPGARRPVKESGEPAQEDEDGPFLARTDAQGRFLFAQVPAERVDLTARRQGYAPGRVRSLRISSGAGPADLGTVILQPGARIEGRVIDRAGKPVAGAEVHLVETVDRIEQQSARLAGERPDALTRADGAFALEDLPPDTALHLLVRASGHLPAGVRGVRAPTPAPLTVRLENGALLRGRIVDEGAEPVAGARVVLTWQPSAPEDRERQTGAPVERSDVSGHDGRFEIRDAPAGTARLAVTAQGYVPVESFEVAVPRSDRDGELTLALERGAVLAGRVSTAAGQPVPGARIVAAGAGAISDDEGAYRVEGVALGPTVVEVSHPAYRRLRREIAIEPGVNPLDSSFEDGVEVAGRVVDARRAPVAGARVTLLRELRGDWREYRERTGEDGTFRFFPVARGRYRLRAGGEGYAESELERPVPVAAEPVDGLEIVVEPGGVIAGRVLGLDADELGRVHVEASSGEETMAATVDADGRYEVRHLRPGDYLVRASLDQGRRQVQARVPLSANAEVTRDLELMPRLTLSGRVLYGDEPLPEAKISLRGHRLAVERTVWTDYQGAYRFDDLEPDTYWLGLSQPRELLVHNETLEVSGELDHPIRLRPAAVHGVVTDARNGKPVAEALIALRSIAGAEFLITGGTRPDGSFSIYRVPPGTYRLTARAAGYSPVEQELTVPAEQDVSGLEIALAPTAGLELTVSLASGHVPDQVHFRVLDPAGNLVLAETRLPERSGRIALSTVPEGRWTLLLRAHGGAPASLPITVPGDPISLALPTAGQLRIEVPALAATDLRATATVSAGSQPFWTLGRGGSLENGWPMVAGRAVVEGLPAGVWQIRVEAPDGRVWTAEAATFGHGETAVALQ